MKKTVSDSKQYAAIDYSSFPNAAGHFGPYGGRFVSETLIYALDELETIYKNLKDDPSFQAEFDKDLAHYVGRPSPLYLAERWTRELGGAEIFEMALPYADELIVTEVDASPDGDTFFPPIEESEWRMVSRKDFSKDEKNEYAYSFVTYHRK